MVKRVRLDVASMGPRPFGRGQPNLIINTMSPLASLQWGRDLSAADSCTDMCRIAERSACFNGAATFRPRTARNCLGSCRARRSFNGAATFRPRTGRDFGPQLAAERRLQWGRDLSAADRRPTPALRMRTHSASMGPRPFGRGQGDDGDDGTQRECCFNGAATFRPRTGQCGHC